MGIIIIIISHFSLLLYKKKMRNLLFNPQQNNKLFNKYGSFSRIGMNLFQQQQQLEQQQLEQQRRLYATGKRKMRVSNKGVLTQKQAMQVKGKDRDSTEWLRRQLTDPYIRLAREENVSSRAYFKLKELDMKYEILRRGMRVVDLGCWPGGWTELAVKRVVTGELNQKDMKHSVMSLKKEEEKFFRTKGMVIGIDKREMENAIPGCEFIQGDFTSSEDGVQEKILELLPNGQADVILSDMAPKRSGRPRDDHNLLMNLAEDALEFAKNTLVEGGHFIVKLSRGGDEQEIKKAAVEHFQRVVYAKPPSSRVESREIYLVCMNFKK